MTTFLVPVPASAEYMEIDIPEQDPDVGWPGPTISHSIYTYGEDNLESEMSPGGGESDIDSQCGNYGCVGAAAVAIDFEGCIVELDASVDVAVVGNVASGSGCIAYVEFSVALGAAGTLNWAMPSAHGTVAARAWETDAQESISRSCHNIAPNSFRLCAIADVHLEAESNCVKAWGKAKGSTGAVASQASLFLETIKLSAKAKSASCPSDALSQLTDNLWGSEDADSPEGPTLSLEDLPNGTQEAVLERLEQEVQTKLVDLLPDGCTMDDQGTEPECMLVQHLFDEVVERVTLPDQLTFVQAEVA